MDVLIRARGATLEERTRGAEAARQVFERTGISPQDAAHGMSLLEAWDGGGFEGDLTEDESLAADAWLEATRAAYEACCGNWEPDRNRPTTVYLELLTDPENQLADRATALQKLRQIANATPGPQDEPDFAVSTLAMRVAADLGDEWLAGSLVDNLTVAHTALWLARDGVEIKRQAVLDAIDALEQATEMRH